MQTKTPVRAAPITQTKRAVAKVVRITEQPIRPKDPRDLPKVARVLPERHPIKKGPATIPELVERAVRALKGVTDITEDSVANRAAMYPSKHRRDKIMSFVKKLTRGERTVYGFAGTEKKKERTVKKRPVPPTITAKGLN